MLIDNNILESIIPINLFTKSEVRMAKDKTIMQLITELYRNNAYTVGECVEDMLSTDKITLEDLKKDRSLKKLDWHSVKSHVSSLEVQEIALQKISG